MESREEAIMVGCSLKRKMLEEASSAVEAEASEVDWTTALSVLDQD